MTCGHNWYEEDARLARVGGQERPPQATGLPHKDPITVELSGAD